jgi:hypothetical protein
VANDYRNQFQVGDLHLSLLTDPVATNKVSTATDPLGYAAEKKLPAAVRVANAAFKAVPPAAVYMPYWDVWGAAFGGVNNTRGDNAAATSDLYTRVGGVAAGADYRFGQDSLIGFSLAGGNINWTVNSATVAGGGSSDAFMAGIYGKYGFGAGYLSGAATYTNYWIARPCRALATCTARTSMPRAGVAASKAAIVPASTGRSTGRLTPQSRARASGPRTIPKRFSLVPQPMRSACRAGPQRHSAARWACGWTRSSPWTMAIS